MKPLYTQILTPGERTATLRAGMYAKFAEAGVSPSKIDDFVKDADVSSMLGGAAKTVATIALMTGVPLGIAAHAIGKQMKVRRKREKELIGNIGFYSDAARDLETNLAAGETQV